MATVVKSPAQPAPLNAAGLIGSGRWTTMTRLPHGDMVMIAMLGNVASAISVVVPGALSAVLLPTVIVHVVMRAAVARAHVVRSA